MIKLTNTTSSTVSANGTVPLNLKFNSNPNISFSNNTITINKPGYYNIYATFNITANATTSNIGLYNNGTLIPETNTTISTTSGDEYQVVVIDKESVGISFPITQRVNLTFQSTTGAIFDVSNVSIDEVR